MRQATTDLIPADLRNAAIMRQKRLRVDSGLSAKELGAKLGVSASTIHRWESPADGACPNVRQLYALCLVFDCSPTWLMFGIGFQGLSQIEEHHRGLLTGDRLRYLMTRVESLLDRLDAPD